MQNIVTGKQYTRANAERLSEKGYTSPFWGTFGQWCSIGRMPGRGERGTMLFRKDAKGFQKYHVFNMEQTVEAASIQQAN